MMARCVIIEGTDPHLSIYVFVPVVFTESKLIQELVEMDRNWNNIISCSSWSTHIM